MTVIIVGVISAFMVINNEAPTAKQLEVSNTEDNNKTEKKEELNGWKQEKGNWYFYKDNEKQKNWVQDKNSWYFLGSDGKMRTGWIQDKDEWYYMNEDGTMATNTTIDGCYLGKDGTIEDTPVKHVNREDTNQNSNNNIFINSPDQVLDIIRKNDSVYLENTQREIGSNIKLFYCGDNDDYISMVGENCYGVELFTEYEDEINYYLVGKYTGNVYILPHEGSYNAYQIKNNQVVKTIHSGGKDWR